MIQEYNRPTVTLDSVPQRTYLIGRDRGCDLPIPDDSVSRIHAEITPLPNQWLLVVDRNSSNGTYVLQNGVPHRIEQAYVGWNDVLQFGGAVIRVSELMHTLQQRTTTLAGPVPMAPPTPVAHFDPGATIPAPPPMGARLVRCGCGVVKTAGVPCPECGRV
jgi:predicted component of type VI protein secretion system